jgi:NHL repeat
MRWDGEVNMRLGLAQERSRLPSRVVWTALLMVIALACLAPASTPAAYVPQPPIGSPGPDDGEVELVAPHLGVPRTAGSGLAVNDTTHNLYVGDTDNHRVTVFASDGTFVGAFGADVGGPGIDVCTIGCVAGTPGTSPGAFEDPTFVAVDNSPSASNGDVYVVDSATNVISKFEADGTLVTIWGTGGQLNGSTAIEGPFEQIGGIVVDSIGTLDVYRSQPLFRIFRFTEAGVPIATLPAAGAGSPGGLGVDSSGDFFKTNGTPSVEKLAPDGTDIGRVTASTEHASLAVDTSTGELFVVGTDGTINRYAFPPCVPAPSPFGGCPPTEVISDGLLLAEGGGLAVDSATHTLYAADPSTDEIFPFKPVTTPDVITTPAAGVGAESATLNGEVNPNGAPLTECFFEWGTTTAYGQIAPCEDPDFEEVGEDTEFVDVHADISGLDPGTEYHFQLAAANANNAPGETIPGGDEDFQTLGPSIRNEAFSQVTASGAKVSGEVNPNGVATSFVVEYVTEAQFLLNGFTDAEQSQAQQVGSETTFKAVTQQLSGLDPQTAYRFRLVATNADATVVGTGGKFTTFALPTTDLPDNRKYEMVSPPQKTGEVIAPEPNTDLGGSCGECLPGINAPTMAMQAAPDGDAVLYEGQPFSGGLAAGPNEYVSERSPSNWSTASRSTPTTSGVYVAFSSDLSLGVLSQVNPTLSPLAPTQGTQAFANLYLGDEAGAFEPLVTTEPPNRIPGNPSADAFSAVYAGANSGSPLVPEFSHLLLEANDALTEEVEDIAPQAPEVAAGDCTLSTSCNLYEWVEGELRLVNVLPGNTSASTSAVIGAGRLLAGTPQAEAADVDRAISDDGSRIFWSEEATDRVFVRVDGEETLEIPGPGPFLTASADGSSVLLSDGQLYELSEAGPEAYVEGEDLTEGQGGFQGILGASEDLSHVYFIATSDLTGAEENESGEEAEAGKLNLYSWEEGDVSFIGALLAGDGSFGLNARYGAWKAAPSNRVAQVTPDGRFLAFMSLARLTGYDNRLNGGGQCRGSSGEACRQVFLYEADSETLSCASCNPSGQRPLGGANLTLLRPQGPPFRQPNNLSSDGGGRLFFESLDALVPQDTNGNVQDVYQWEPEGLGSCEQQGGCVSLISSGHAADDTMFLDSGASGNDIFFITREQVLPRDKDEQLDVYDARVAGGIPEPQPDICSGEACADPLPPPPPQQSAPTATFSGPGNPKQNKPGCKKGFVKKKGKCKKKKGKTGKGQAKRNRGGSR